MMNQSPGRAGVADKYLESYDANYSAYTVGITSGEVVDFYNKHSSTYNSVLPEDFYKGPYLGGQFVKKYCDPDAKPKILDIGAGSGRVGHELSQLGFTNLHALEPAQDFFFNSPYKTCYQSALFVTLGKEEVPLLVDDSFDAVITVGTFGEGHIPCAALNEMIRCVKPGGHVIIVMREEYLVYVEEYYNRLEPYMKELQEAGKWKLIERSASLKDYALGKDGITFVFSVLECGYKKFTSVVLRE